MKNYRLFYSGNQRLTTFHFLPERPSTDLDIALRCPETAVLLITMFHQCSIDLSIYHFRKNVGLPVKLVIDYSMEGCVNIEDLYRRGFGGVEFDDMLFVHNSTHKQQIEETIGSNFYIDFHAVDAYNKCILRGHPINAVPVVNRTNGLSLLIGKIKVKNSRFLATYYFYKYGLLDNAVLGIHATPEDFKLMMEKHSIDDKEFYNKILTCLGPADKADLCDSGEGLSAMDGWPYDPNIYNRSSVSYICETFDVDKGTMILNTEKFYRSITNKHPFVIQAAPGYMKRVKTIGYETFSSIIDEGYNDYNKLDLSHVEPTVLAAKDFLSKVPGNTEKLQEIVDHNFNHFMKTSKAAYHSYLNVIDNFASGRPI